MIPDFLERAGRTIAGIELPAGAPPPFILQLWVKLGTVMDRVSDVVEPSIMYGVWRKSDRGEDIDFTYLVGVEARTTDQADGIRVWELPAAPCAVFRPTGDMGRISGSFEEIRRWFMDESNPHKGVRSGYTMELYDTRQPLDDHYVVQIWEELAV